jgi:hypothetical protein
VDVEDEDWAFLREPKAPAECEYTGPPRCAVLAEIFVTTGKQWFDSSND